MRESFFDRHFVQRYQLPVDGDTPLMQAIRNGDRAGIAALLDSSEVDLSARNSAGETALFLALQAGEYELATRLHGAGAADAEEVITDDRFGVVPYRPSRSDGPLGDAEVEWLLAATIQHSMHILTCEDRTRVRAAIAQLIEDDYPRSKWRKPLTNSQRHFAATSLETLRKNGIVEFGRMLDPDQVADIRRYLAAQPVYAGHAPELSDGNLYSIDDIEKRGGRFASYDRAAVLAAPHLLDLANDPVVLEIISEYFGCTPTIYSTNIHWSFPSDRPDREMFTTESAHRDYNDFSDVSMFIYLNDVDAESGPHRYFRRTHDLDRAIELLQRRFPAEMASLIGRDLFRSIWEGHGRTGLLEDLVADEIRDVTGPAGTVFLDDVFGFHRALPPRRRPRLFAWVRFSTKPLGLVPYQAGISGVSERHDPYINRLLPSLRDTPIQRLELDPAVLTLLVNGYSDTAYNIFQFEDTFYAVSQLDGPIDIDKVRSGCLASPVYAGSSMDEVVAQLETHRAQAARPAPSDREALTTLS